MSKVNLVSVSEYEQKSQELGPSDYQAMLEVEKVAFGCLRDGEDNIWIMKEMVEGALQRGLKDDRFKVYEYGPPIEGINGSSQP